MAHLCAGCPVSGGEPLPAQPHPQPELLKPGLFEIKVEQFSAFVYIIGGKYLERMDKGGWNERLHFSLASEDHNRVVS